MGPIRRRLFGTDLTAEDIRKLTEYPEVLDAMLAAMRAHPRFTLIHGVYNKTDDVLASFKARCAAKDVDFGWFSWVGSEQAPEFNPDDPETVVVLDATLDTLQNTFEFAWAWMADGQKGSRRAEYLVSGPRDLLPLVDAPVLRPYTLRWVKIKLDANIGKAPVSVRSPSSSPGCALLYLGAEHPYRIRTIGFHKNHLGFFIPGLRCVSPCGHRDFGTPYIHSYSDHFHNIRVGLHSLSCSQDDGGLAVPIYL